MRLTMILAGIVLIAGCSSNRMYYSPYDLDRDGTLDAECPGVEYDPTRHTHYGWRSEASKECHESMKTSS